MTTLLFSLALAALTGAIIVLLITTKQLIKEIESIDFELSLLRRQVTEDEQLLSRLEDNLDLLMYYNGETTNQEGGEQ